MGCSHLSRLPEAFAFLSSIWDVNTWPKCSGKGVKERLGRLLSLFPSHSVRLSLFLHLQTYPPANMRSYFRWTRKLDKRFSDNGDYNSIPCIFILILFNWAFYHRPLYFLLLSCCINKTISWLNSPTLVYMSFNFFSFQLYFWVIMNVWNC